MKRLLACVLVAVAGSAAGCSPAPARPAAASGGETPSTPPAAVATSLPAPDGDVGTADSVAVAEVEATWTLDTTVGFGWYDGELAATAYMTPSYAAQIWTHPPAGGPGATWMAWAAHQVTTTVAATVEDDPGGPADTATAAYRKVVATVTPHGAGGWTGTPQVWVTYVVLSRPAAGTSWLVATTETNR